MARKIKDPSKRTFRPDDELVSIQEAIARLGKGYSRSSIFRRIRAGEWEEGVHYIDDRREESELRIIKINLTAVQELRATPAAFR
jgi:hypothetical protein